MFYEKFLFKYVSGCGRKGCAMEEAPQVKAYFPLLCFPKFPIHSYFSLSLGKLKIVSVLVFLSCIVNELDFKFLVTLTVICRIKEINSKSYNIFIFRQQRIEMRISSHSILASVALVALCSLLSAAQDTNSNETLSGSRDGKGKAMRNCIIFVFWVSRVLCQSDFRNSKLNRNKRGLR